MSNPWDNLPNAKHIDFVLEHVKLHPNVWNIAWNAARDAAWNAAWEATREVVRAAARNAAWNAARKVARDTAWEAACDALIALIAFDDCAHLLYSDPKEVEILAKLGVPAAVLLLSASVAISKTKEEKCKF